MDEVNFHNTSNRSVYWDNEYDDGNFSVVPVDEPLIPDRVLDVVVWIVACVGLPLTLLAIYFLLLLVRGGQVVSVYVINLLTSDLIQIISMVIKVAQRSEASIQISLVFHVLGLLASVGFMVCIAVERYLVMACPLWYRFKRSVKLSVIVSVIVWALSVAEYFIPNLLPDSFRFIFCCIFFLLPFPILLFSLVGSLKALSRAIAVPPKEKCRIIGTLVLVLLIYTLLFLPAIIYFLQIALSFYLSDVPVFPPDLPFWFLVFSPLADLFLYVLMRPGAADRLLFCHRCCETAEEEPGQNIPAVEPSVDHVSSV